MSTLIRFSAIAAFVFLVGCDHIESQQAGKAGRPAAVGGQSSDSHVWHMRKAADTQQFKDLVTNEPFTTDMISVLVPTDWTFADRASLPPNNKQDCLDTAGRINFMARSPDKSTGLLVQGMFPSIWSTNPAVVQEMRAHFGSRPTVYACEIAPAQPMGEGLSGALPKFLPGNQAVGGLEPIPGLSDQMPAAVAQANRQMAAEAAQNHVPASHLTAEAGRLRFAGKSPEGKAQEGWMIAIATTRSDPLPQGGVIETHDIPLLAVMFAPPGKLEANEKLLTAILDSARISPQYTAWCQQLRARTLAAIDRDNAQTSRNIAAMNQQTQQQLGRIQREMAADNARTAATNAGIQQDTQRYSAQVHANVTADRAAAFDHSAQQFSLHMGDQAVYKDPSTGQKVQLSNQYSHAWASTTGNTNEYILTDSPSYNPNGQAGSAGWTQMQPQN